MTVRYYRCLLAVGLILGSASLAHAGNPVSWILQTNGWAWSDGYHANNGCVKTGALPRSYVPTASSYPAPWDVFSHEESAVYHNSAAYQNSPAVQPYYAPPRPTPAPMMQETLPPVQKYVPPVPGAKLTPEAYYQPSNRGTNAPFPQYMQPQPRTASRPMPVRP